MVEESLEMNHQAKKKRGNVEAFDWVSRATVEKLVDIYILYNSSPDIWKKPKLWKQLRRSAQWSSGIRTERKEGRGDF